MIFSRVKSRPGLTTSPSPAAPGANDVQLEARNDALSGPLVRSIWYVQSHIGRCGGSAHPRVRSLPRADGIGVPARDQDPRTGSQATLVLLERAVLHVVVLVVEVEGRAVDIPVEGIGVSNVELRSAMIAQHCSCRTRPTTETYQVTLGGVGPHKVHKRVHPPEARSAIVFVALSVSQGGLRQHPMDEV